MLAADVRIQDIDPSGWVNLLRLADPDTVRRLAGESHRTPRIRTRLLVIFDEKRVLKSYHSEKGSILEGFTWNGPLDLETVARREDVHEVIAIERGALGRIYRRFQQKINLRDDYVKQLLEIYDSIRREVKSGLYFYPPLHLKPIKYNFIQSILSLLIPDNSTVVFYIFDDNRVWTSAILGIEQGDVDLFTSHGALMNGMVTINNWREDYKRILSAVNRMFRRPSVGIFGDVSSFANVLRARKTLRALTEARKRRDIIIEPLPMRIKSILGVGRLLGL